VGALAMEAMSQTHLVFLYEFIQKQAPITRKAPNISRLGLSSIVLIMTHKRPIAR